MSWVLPTCGWCDVRNDLLACSFSQKDLRSSGDAFVRSEMVGRSIGNFITELHQLDTVGVDVPLPVPPDFFFDDECTHQACSSQVSASLPPVKQERTASVALAMAANLTSFSPEEMHILRGSSYRYLLRMGGAIFADSGGSAATFELSKEVSKIDIFISHNWSTGRWSKFLVLACYFNLEIAGFGLIVLALSCCVLNTSNVFPMVKARSACFGGNMEIDIDYISCLVCTPLFLLLAIVGHELVCNISIFSQSAFLDKTCIHQVNHDLKKKGITKLGAFLACSSRMLVCYTDTYLRKLWTVYEIACFLCLHPVEDMIIIHVSFAKILWFGLVFCYGAFLAYFVIITHWQFTIISLHNFLEIEAAFAVGIFAMGVGGTSCLRFLAVELHNTRQRIAEFDVHEVTCFCADDRPLVEDNIFLILRRFGKIKLTSTREEALEIFNCMVREKLPDAIEASMGFGKSVKLPYRFLFYICLPTACVGAVVFTSNELKRNDLLRFFGHLMLILNFFLIRAPVHAQITAFLTSRCIELRGWQQHAYILFLSVMMSSLCLLEHGLCAMNILRHFDGHSSTFLLVSLLYVSLWSAIALLAFGGWQLCSRGRNRERPNGLL